MIRDTFFSMPRFVNLCRKDIVENWRTNVLRIALVYGVMTIVLLWMGYLEYNNKSTMTGEDDLWRPMLVFFMWSLWGFGCLSASFTMERMKSKTSRLSTLMTPATSFEKYFSRWLVSTLAFLVVFLIAFRLADYTRVLVYTLVYPQLEAIASLPFSHLAGDTTEYYVLFRDTNDFILIITLYFFSQSCFVLGSSIGPKNAFLKTFAGLAVIVAVYALLMALMFELFFRRDSSVFISDDNFALISFIVLSVFTLFNWTLAYFRFKESEIINRM